jgi:hypothetical protein
MLEHPLHQDREYADRDACESNIARVLRFHNFNPWPGLTAAIQKKQPRDPTPSAPPVHQP